ncbi:MAG: peptidoglycan recognition family protein [Planctomycetota bacterium]
MARHAGAGLAPGGASGPRRRWSIGALALLAAWAAAGCAAPRGTSASRSPEPAPSAPTRAPEWSAQPNSWGKLSEIERWIAAAPSRRDYWGVEAALQLAEGRLSFATDRLQPGTDPSVVALRRGSAREGFESVITAPAATAEQRRRAELGLARIPDAAVPRPAAAPAPAVGGLVRRAAWKARRPDPTRMRKSTAPWRWITVHHSVFGGESASAAASLDTVRRIQRQHMDVEGYADIGYHFLIDPAGRVIEGRQLSWQGAHAGGENNVGNVGICLLGNFEVQRPTRSALASLDRLVFQIQGRLGIPRNNVRPHRAWKETACPGRHLMPWFVRP